MTFDYKKYSLEQLENWMHDAMSSGEATPQEIYKTIRNVVEENYYIYKNKTSQAYELLTLLNNSNNNVDIYEEVLKERYYYEGVDSQLSCDSDDSSPECQKAWNDFWEDDNNWSGDYKGSTVSSVKYTDEELDAMCDKAESDDEKERCREYNLREAEYYDKRVELDVKHKNAKKWVLPVELDGPSGEYYVMFPDDLLEAANLVENDQVEWIDNGDGSYTLRKVGLMWHPV